MAPRDPTSVAEGQEILAGAPGDPQAAPMVPARSKKPTATPRGAESQKTDSDLPAALGRERDDFLMALRVEAGVSHNTLGAYRRDLNLFLGWAAEQGVAKFTQLDANHLVDHLAEARKAGYAEASLAGRLAAIRGCLRHLGAEGRL